MRNLRFWIPAGIAIFVTPFALLAAFISSGAGHGSYGAMLVLYPLPTCILVLSVGIAPEDAFVAQVVQTLLNDPGFWWRNSAVSPVRPHSELR